MVSQKQKQEQKQEKEQEEMTPIKATASTTEEISWIEYQRTENQAAPHRLEEAAKYLSGLSSISLTIMLGPYSDLFKEYKDVVGLKIGVVCWLISIVLTLAVVFPFPWQYIRNSENSIRKMNGRITKVKFTSLLIGSVCYLLGIIIITCVCLL